MKKLLLFICALSTFVATAQTDYFEALPNNNSTSQNGRAPQGAVAYSKSVWLITAAEMAAGGFTTGTQIQGIGFNIVEAQNTATTGTFKVYLQNTLDGTNTKSTTWATAVTGMTTVHNGNLTIPATEGTFDTAFAGGSPFTYTGGAIYVAFEYANTGTVATVPNTILCNNTLVGGLKGAIGATAASTATVAASNFRPETRLGRAVSCVRPTNVYADVVTENSATLYWTAPTPAPASGYDYYYTTSTTAPTATTTPTGSVAAGVTSVAIPSGLTSGTTYYVYVRSKCSGTSLSAWSSLSGFTTQFGPATPPYAEGFEGDVGGWTLFNAGTGNNWGIYTAAVGGAITTAAEGTNYAGYQYNSASAANAWLFSRKLALTAGSQYTIAFKYRVAGATFPEKLTVKIGNDATVAAQTVELFNNANITTTTWTQATATFTPQTTGNFVVGFNCYSAADMYVLGVDDFTVSAGTAGTNDFLSSKLSVFPNPATNVVNITNADNILVTGVQVIDINGRTVKSVKYDGVTEAQINVSDLASGMYIMNISSDNGTMTKKIVKN